MDHTSDEATFLQSYLYVQVRLFYFCKRRRSVFTLDGQVQLFVDFSYYFGNQRVFTAVARASCGGPSRVGTTKRAGAAERGVCNAFKWQ